MTAQTATRASKALTHEIRRDALRIFRDRAASPKEIAAELGQPLGTVAFHVRALLDHDCIKLKRTTPRRGALEHHYAAKDTATSRAAFRMLDLLDGKVPA